VPPPIWILLTSWGGLTAGGRCGARLALLDFSPLPARFLFESLLFLLFLLVRFISCSFDRAWYLGTPAGIWLGERRPVVD
jgi:hypothetical protein